jgi:hypothetical protein
MASRFSGPQSTTPTPDSAQATAICGQRGFAPPNGGAFAAAEGDPACGVAERLTRKGWPLAANPWRALRKCIVGRAARGRTLVTSLSCPSGRKHSKMLMFELKRARNAGQRLGSYDARGCGRRRPEPARLGRAWVPVNGLLDCAYNGHAQLHNNLNVRSTAI